MIALNPDTKLPTADDIAAETRTLPENAVATPGEIVTALNWRYAVKQYDASRKIDDATWDALQQTLVLAPSSVGLQPYKFFVVDSKDVRAQLREASWGQSQITDADKLIVFSARTGFNESDVDRVMSRVAEVRGVPVESLSGYKGMAMGLVARPEADRDMWASRQAYIALGSLLTTAAALGVDATPMEGLDAAAYDTILGLKAKGYRTFAAVALGYRSADDKYAQLPKVRLAREDVIQHV
jgi:nitroreductase